MTGIPFGKYQLVKRLARGGMAEVFLARQRGPEGFQRLVAVKRILPHLVDAQDFVRMFLDEARLAAQLTHPNVVHVYDFGRVDEHYFIAMEYVDGVHAGVLIQHAERGRLPDVLVARIGADACAGLHYAHELRDAEGRMLHIVHRDVSPPNLLVSYDGSMKLVDFGIAKAVSSIEQTRPGVVKGKFAYMSPEQTVGHKLDGRSDVFSLGVVLWELLAAKLMVPRLDPVEGMRMLRDGRLPPIEQERPDIAPELAAAIGRALTTESEDRCTALELGRALEEFIKGSADGIGSTLELAEWVRVRFPREGPSGSYPEEDDVPAATRPVTGATQTVLRVPDRPTMQLPQAALAALAARMTGAHAAPEPAPAQESLAGQAEARGGVGGRGEEDDRLFAVESSSIIVAPEWLMDDGGSHDFDTVDVQEHDTVTEAADEADDDAEAETHDFRRPHVHTGRDVTRTVLPGDSEVTRAVPPGEVARTIGRHSVEGETIWRGFRRPGTQLAHKAGRIALVIASGAAIAVSAISLVAQLRGAARSGREQESQATLANPSPSAKATQPSSMAALAPSPNAAPNPSPNAAPNPSPNAAANPNAPPTPNPNAALNPNANAALNPSPNPSPNAAANPNAAPRPGAGANPSANAAAPPAAAAAAIIDVVTTPRGARVVLDDQAPVRSPIRFQGLRPGAHRLRVSLRGYQSLERTFAVSVGEHRAIEMDLVAERSAGRGERRSAESRRASRAPTSGVLKVRTRPYCEVYLDGHRLGQTPLVTELKPGRYTLVFKHPGKPRQRRTATVRAGEETRLDFALE